MNWEIVNEIGSVYVVIDEASVMGAIKRYSDYMNANSRPPDVPKPDQWYLSLIKSVKSFNAVILPPGARP